MRGISAALVIVVTAIVLLIIAVVVITIFGSAIAPFGGLTTAFNNCKLQAEASCAATGERPATWDIGTQRVSNNVNLISCSAVYRQAGATAPC